MTKVTKIRLQVKLPDGSWRPFWQNANSLTEKTLTSITMGKEVFMEVEVKDKDGNPRLQSMIVTSV